METGTDSGRLVLTGLAATVLCLLPLGIGLLVSSNDFAASIETETVKVRYEIRGERQPPAGVTLVAVDRRSSEAFFPKWREQGLSFPPFPDRTVWARTIDRLNRAGAEAIVFSFFFSSILPSRNEADAKLASAIRRSGVPVVVGLDCDTTTETGGSSGSPSSRGVLTSSGAVVGSLCLYSDEAVRQVPLRVYGKRAEKDSSDPGLAVALARAMDIPIPKGAFQSSGEEPDAEPERFAWIDFSKSPGAVNSFSLSEVTGTDSVARLRERFDGRVAVVGDTDYDPSFASIPTFSAGDGRLYDGEVQALGVATMLGGFPIKDAPFGIELAGLLLFGLTLPLTSIVLGRRSRVLVWVGLLTILLIGAQLAFEEGMVVPLVTFLATFLSATLVALAVSAFRSRQEIVDLRERFAETDEAAVAAVLAGTVRSGRPSTEQIVPGYRIEALVGRGSSGNVYRATRLHSGEMVALKVVRPFLSGDKDAISQFEREFQAARLLDHPKIVRIVDEGTDEVVYAASEFMPLGDLQQALDAGGTLELEEVLDVGEDVAEALEVAHGVGLIHRDVKPSNIFRAHGGFKLGDFGIARLSGESTATVGSGGITGTIAFAAPEQLGATDERIDVSTDVYGLAATLVTLMTGSPPFLQATLGESIAAKLRGDPIELSGDLVALAPVLSGALAVSPDERPQTPTAFVQSLRRAVDKSRVDTN